MPVFPAPPCCLYLEECRFDKGTGGRHVHAHETAALYPERSSVIESYTGFPGHETEQFLVSQPQAPQVEPHEVGAFGNGGPDFGKVFCEEPDSEFHVAVYVVEHLAEPLFAFVVGGDERRRAEDVALVDMVPAQFRPQRFPGGGVGRDGRGGRKPGDIEGFCRGDERDAPLSFGAQRSDVGVAAGSEYQVGVYLVAHYRDIVFPAQVGYSAQLLRSEYAAGGVVWIAEEQYRGLCQFAV